MRRYYRETGKVPTAKNFHYNYDYPSEYPYMTHFGSWNFALKEAGLQIRKYVNLSNIPNFCELCGTTETTKWLDKDGLKMCYKCYTYYKYNSLHLHSHSHGMLSPDSTVGMGVITEHIVSEVLNDCKKCNIKTNFHAKYDLISEKYGTVNVKSFKLAKDNRWKFKKCKSQMIPDHYICIGFDSDKSKIEHVWIIPNNSKLITNTGITIAKNNLARAVMYEVDSTIYNKMYQNLNIYLLPEFKNIYTHCECECDTNEGV